MYRYALYSLFVSASLLSAASLRGSKASQELQNNEADREKLTRIENDAQLERFELGSLLVKLPTNRTIQIDDRLDPKWRWCRPWTARFLRDTAQDYFAQFHELLQVNSAVRTEEYQRTLKKRNGNAASADGKRKSSHPTGSTIDLAKKDMTKDEVKWLRRRLLSLEERGLIEATEEHRQLCFHIMVFNSYRRNIQ